MARRQSGVLDLFGGLALGLSQSMQANRDAGLKQEFLKAQMDEAKAKAKHYEAKVKADLMKEQMMANPGKYIGQIASQFGYQGEGAIPQEGLPATPPQMPMQAPAPQQGAPAAPMAPMSGGGGGGRVNFGGIDFTGYAEDPNWPNAVGSILQQIPALASGKDIDTVIANYAPNSPLIGQGEKIFQLAQQGGYDPRLPIAIGIQESALGTKGLATKTRNPWNIGGDNPDQRYYFSDVGQGVDAFHDWTMRRKGRGGQQPDVTQQIAQAQTDQQMKAQQALPKVLAQVPTNENGVLDFSDLPQPVRMAIDMWGKMALDMDFNLTKSNIQVRGNTKDGYIITSGTRIVRRIPGEGSVALRETPQGVMAVREPTAGELKQTGPQVVAPLPFKLGREPSLDAQGRKRMTYFDENRPWTVMGAGEGTTPPIGQGAGGGLGTTPPAMPPNTIITEPSPREKAPVMPDKIREEITEIGTAIKHIGILRNTVKPEYLGMWAKYAKGAMDEYGGSLGLGSPERYTFRQNYEELIGQKLRARGGTAQTESEKRRSGQLFRNSLSQQMFLRLALMRLNYCCKLKPTINI